MIKTFDWFFWICRFYWLGVETGKTILIICVIERTKNRRECDWYCGIVMKFHWFWGRLSCPVPSGTLLESSKCNQGLPESSPRLVTAAPVKSNSTQGHPD